MTEKNYSQHKRNGQNLANQMSLIELVSQMRNSSKSIKRLNIKQYNWWNEGLHGVARAGIATVFPQAICMASSFDADAVKQCADIISTEARAKFNESQKNKDYSIYKGLTLWSPDVNIFRDPRWGRGHETLAKGIISHPFYGEITTVRDFALIIKAILNSLFFAANREEKTIDKVCILRSVSFFTAYHLKLLKKNIL